MTNSSSKQQLQQEQHSRNTVEQRKQHSVRTNTCQAYTNRTSYRVCNVLYKYVAQSTYNRVYVSGPIIYRSTSWFKLNDGNFPPHECRKLAPPTTVLKKGRQVAKRFRSFFFFLWRNRWEVPQKARLENVLRKYSKIWLRRATVES